MLHGRVAIVASAAARSFELSFMAMSGGTVDSFSFRMRSPKTLIEEQVRQDSLPSGALGPQSLLDFVHKDRQQPANQLQG